MEVPEVPATFTKFASSLSGPFDDIPIVGTAVDWEVELVAVVGRQADNVSVDDAWSHIAGLTVGQDISDRKLQMAAGRQFSLGKSRRGFGPMGPWIVTPDEFDNPDDLALGCSIDGEVVQDARSSDLIFDIPTLIAELSSVLTPTQVMSSSLEPPVEWEWHVHLHVRSLQATSLRPGWKALERCAIPVCDRPL